MSINHSIILCQPDSSKGCCVCCGLFNFKDITEYNLSLFLENSPQSKSTNSEIDDIQTIYHDGIRDITSYVCQYQGFISTNKPGCTRHHELLGYDGRGISLYGSKICNDYLCPAHSLLNYEYKSILINSVFQWYLYSIAIIDPASFVWCVDFAKKYLHGSLLGRNRIIFTKYINNALRIHGEYLTKTIKELFFYSVFEYKQYSSSFFVSNNKIETIEIQTLLYTL